MPEFVKIGNRELNLSAAVSSIDKYCVLMSPTTITFECNGKVESHKIEESQSNYAVSIKGLRPNAQYKCTTLVTNEKGSSPKSEVAVITTLQECKENF